MLTKTLMLEKDAEILQLFPDEKKNNPFIVKQTPSVYIIYLFSSNEEEMPKEVFPDTIYLRQEGGSITAYWSKSDQQVIKKSLDMKLDGLEEIVPFFPKEGDLRSVTLKWSDHQKLINKITSLCLETCVNQLLINEMIKMFGCTFLKDEQQRDESVFNTKALISKINVLENKNMRGKDLCQYSSQSWHVTAETAMKMIKNIKEDQKTCERAARGECDYLLYQQVGKNHFLSDLDAGDNCAGWVIDKLIVAGLGDEVAGLQTKPKIVAGKSCIIL